MTEDRIILTRDPQQMVGKTVRIKTEYSTRMFAVKELMPDNTLFAISGNRDMFPFGMIASYKLEDDEEMEVYPDYPKLGTIIHIKNVKHADMQYGLPMEVWEEISTEGAEMVGVSPHGCIVVKVNATPGRCWRLDPYDVKNFGVTADAIYKIGDAYIVPKEVNEDNLLVMPDGSLFTNEELDMINHEKWYLEINGRRTPYPMDTHKAIELHRQTNAVLVPA